MNSLFINSRTYADIPSPRSGAAAVCQPMENYVLLYGGYDGISYLDDLYTLDTKSLIWTRMYVIAILSLFYGISSGF